ncbi:MAG: type II/IV secretion system protein [Campylobacterales bacterium]|nr:type II/IV secretion system protein [Campylobacterales bacterium]
MNIPTKPSDAPTHSLKRSEYYVAQGMITREMQALACDVQRVSGRSVDEILIAYGFITEFDRMVAESREQNIPYIDLDANPPSPEALILLPKEVVLKHRVVPYACTKTTLIVAASSTYTLRSLQLLERFALREVRLVYAQTSQIAEALKHYFERPYLSQKEALHVMVAQSGEVPIVTLSDALIHTAIDMGASDIHLSPEEDALHLFLRLDGVLQHYVTLPIAIRDQVVSRIKIMCDLDIAQRRIAQDGSMSLSYEGRDYDMRVSTMPTDLGESVVIRILTNTKELFQLEQLGLSDEVLRRLKRLAKKPYGVILLSGPTGSGKTTTLYAILREMNRLQKNILTIENPIEYRIPFVNQTQYNPKAGYTYDKAIRAFMRQDPDIILVGEIRDIDTAQIAMEASITGHLVLSTVHTNDAIGALVRLRGLKVPSFLLSEGMLAVIAQRLVRRLCPLCKKARSYSREELLAYGIGAAVVTQEHYDLFEAQGCDHCNHTGYHGRQAITELFEVDERVKMMIFEETSTVEILSYVTAQGMRTLKEDMFRLIAQGATTLEEYERVIL